MALRILALAVISLLVTLFNLLVAANALAEGKRRFALGPLGIGLVTACGTLSAVMPNADANLRLLAGVGALLATSGFAVEAFGELGIGVARTVITLAAVSGVPVLYWPSYLALRFFDLAEASGERLSLLLRVLAAAALGFLFLAHAVIARRPGDPRQRDSRHAAAILAAAASISLVLALAAFVRFGVGVDPALVEILVAEAYVLTRVLDRRVVVRVLLSRSLTYSALVSGVALLGAAAFRALGYAVDLRLIAVVVAVALLAAVIVLGLGEVLSRGVERVLFPRQARLAYALTEAQGEVAALRARLERTERLAIAGELAAAVAHEIKNPLAAVRGYAELLGDLLSDVPGPLDAPSRLKANKAVRIIREESDRIDERVGALLRVGKPAHLSPPARATSLALGPLVLEAVAVVEAEPGAPALVPRVERGLRRVRGDPDAIRGALVNLLRNAIEAGSTDAITATAFGEGAHAVVEICDRGPGLAAEIEGRLFEPFRTTKPTGTGLGLVIARSAAEAHGGSLSLQSRTDGPGAVARLTLPYSEEA